MMILSESFVIRYEMKIFFFYKCLIFVGKIFLNKCLVFKFYKVVYVVFFGFIKFCNVVFLSFMYKQLFQVVFLGFMQFSLLSFVNCRKVYNVRFWYYKQFYEQQWYFVFCYGVLIVFNKLSKFFFWYVICWLESNGVMEIFLE